MSPSRITALTNSLEKRRLAVSGAEAHGHDHVLTPKTDVELETPNDNISPRQRKFFSTAKIPESNLKAMPFGRFDDDGIVSSKPTGGQRLLSSTSAALTKFKGMTIRSGTNGQVLKPRSVNTVTSLSSPERRKGRDNHAFPGAPVDSPISIPGGKPIEGGQNCSPERHNSSRPKRDGTAPSIEETIYTNNKEKLSVLFDDEEESNDAESKESDNSKSDDQEHEPNPRSKWASTLMASTLARAKASGKPTARGRVDLLPHPRDAGNKVGE